MNALVAERWQEVEHPEKRTSSRMVDLLFQEGITTFFGIPGGAISPLYDALLDHAGMRLVHTRHETGAVFMAMGFAHSSGQLPALFVTSGPGISNAITGLAAAKADGIPLLVFGGEVSRKHFGRGALQEGSRYGLDVLSMVRPVTKFCAEITSPSEACSLVHKAIQEARSGRPGPVFLSVPIDVSNAPVGQTLRAYPRSIPVQYDPEWLEEAVNVLQTAQHGLIFVGTGAWHPRTVAAIRDLAERLQMPVATTPRAKGLFPETSRLSLGVFGHGGHPSATRYLEEEIDVLLSIGCGLGEPGTNAWSPLLIPKRCFIQIEVDDAQIGRNYRPDIALVGPAQHLLPALVEKVKPSARRFQGGVTYHTLLPRRDSARGLEPAEAIRGLQARFPDDTIFSTDIGEHLLFAIHYLRLERPFSFLAHTGLGSMGSGIGSAIGARLANPERPVVALCGDFGFQMFGMELATCVQQGIGVVFAIFNDARMGMVENAHARIFGRTPPAAGTPIDFCAIAQAVGARGCRIRSLQDIRDLPDTLIDGSQPLVLDIQISPDAAFPANARAATLRNFTGG